MTALGATDLRLVTWNCAGALRKKWRALESLAADLLVIQECEDPSRAKDPAYLDWAGHYLWEGVTKSKGIGVFARNGLRLEREPIDATDLQYFLPCRIDGDWPLLATWTGRAGSGPHRYIGQLWLFLRSHRAFVDHPRGLVIGDLNSNCRWDKPHRTCNHGDVVRELSEAGLESAYHRHYGEEQGSESRPTFFLQRNFAKSYHIDYAFLGAQWKERSIQVGAVADWMPLSDHVPLLLEVDRRPLYAHEHIESRKPT